MTMDSTGARSLSGVEDPHPLDLPFGRCRSAPRCPVMGIRGMGGGPPGSLLACRRHTQC
jgi:hypothetical protein